MSNNSAFVFTSPSVQFKTLDLTYVQKATSVTNLGLVGETQIGPAFEPVQIQHATQFLKVFGSQSTQKFSGNGNLQYHLPYVANAYLSESNGLYITRILGLSGYHAGTGWAVVLSAGANTSLITTGSTVTGTSSFTGGVYLGTAIYNTGQTGSFYSGFTKTSTTGFTEVVTYFNVLTLNSGSGNVHTKKVTLNAPQLTGYDNMVLAVIRSRGNVTDNINAAPTTTFTTTGLTISSNTTVVGSGNLFGDFNLNAVGSSGSASYKVSLNPNNSDFITNVIGFGPKDKNTMIWVEQVYPELIAKLDADGLGYGVKTQLINLKSASFTDYTDGFQTPATPYVVSELRGNTLARLFRFIMISDGDSANKQIKIGIQNINPIDNTFDVVIRDFNDTDDQPLILEQFSKCSMYVGTNGYIGTRIGTSDGTYNLQSSYVMVEIDENAPEDAFPAGFEGYNFKDYSISATTTTSGLAGLTPKIFYKTSYSTTDKINKNWLGMSNFGYNSLSGGVVSTGINQNYFNYNGKSGFKYSHGFHMDSGVTTFEGFTFDAGAGSFKNITDISKSTNPYYNIATRKFILVPAGGFDGWDVNRGYRTYGDLYADNGIYDGVAPNTPAKNDFQAWTIGINTFNNPDQVVINLFGTPGLNWSDQNLLVRNTIEMIETVRTDSLYVIDAPDIDVVTSLGDTTPADITAANDIADLLNTASIDSSYSCTYFPWIQMRDTQNNINLYLPPTGEVFKAMAFTDNSSYPWFAPAGLQRGATDAKKSKYKFSLAARDILYDARINPLADFPDSGTAIFGQKTLQVAESDLDRINVRRLILQLKVLISVISVRLLFEQADQTTIDQFITKVTPILDTIKRERGLFDYRIKMDSQNNPPESLDRNQLFAEIYLKTVKSAEFFGISFILTPTGAAFAV